MSNEIREKDHEWVKAFHSNFDRLLALLEKLLEKRQPSAYGDELLTDKEVAYLLKVSRRTLQDYRNNGILPYRQVGGKILYRASDIEKDTDERVQGSVQEIMDMFVLLYNLHHLSMEMVQIFAIAHIVYKSPL